MTQYNLSGKRIWVAGHNGMVGSALCRRLQKEGPAEILTVSSTDLDLTRQTDVEDWINMARPDAVFMAAAKVGGIVANDSYPAEFLYDNLMIAANVCHAAYKARVEKLLFLGSSCIYPKFADQPIGEDALMTGPLEPTNEAYAVAKISGLKLCEMYRRQYDCDFISAMPTNLYGPGDNFHPENSHVIPGLIQKFHSAKMDNATSVKIWGTGTPRREFLHVDDCADALITVMQAYSDKAHINIGTGVDISILELANIIAEIVGFGGDILTDATKPDGTPRKLLDTSRLTELGWQAKIDLHAGLKNSYDWFVSQYDSVRRV